MFGHVFRHELRLFRENRSWWGSLLALGLLTVLAAFNGQARIGVSSDKKAQLESEAQLMRDTVTNQLRAFAASSGAAAPAAANPGAMGFSILTTPAVLPPRPLLPLALGQSDNLTDHYRVTAHAAHTFMNEAAIANPQNLLAGSFDTAFVIVFVLPVFIIALSFDLLSREKEHGILALTLAHGVALPAYTLAKCAARTCIVLTITLGISVLGFAVSGIGLNSVTALRDGAIWLGVVLVYAMFWFALGLYVNALDRRSETNGILMANTWLVAVVVLPALVNVTATAAFPAPSRVTLTTELREAASEAEQSAAAAREAYFFDHPELASGDTEPGAFFREVLASDAAIADTIDPLLAEFEEQAALRARVVRTLQYLSPAILAQQALTVTAGTDDERYAAFRRQVRDYHRNYQNFFGERLLAEQLMTPADMAAIPAFAFDEADNPLPRVAAPLAALLVFSTLLVAGALWRFRRYSVLQPA